MQLHHFAVRKHFVSLLHGFVYVHEVLETAYHLIIRLRPIQVIYFIFSNFLYGRTPCTSYYGHSPSDTPIFVTFLYIYVQNHRDFNYSPFCQQSASHSRFCAQTHRNMTKNVQKSKKIQIKQKIQINGFVSYWTVEFPPKNTWFWGTNTWWKSGVWQLRKVTRYLLCANLVRALMLLDLFQLNRTEPWGKRYIPTKTSGRQGTWCANRTKTEPRRHKNEEVK